MNDMIFFTLITNKYLAHAKLMINSFLKYNNGKFVIGLIDCLTDDLSIYDDIEVIPVESIGIAEFEEMTKKYSSIELLTACKPFYFKFLMNLYPNSNSFIYLDADIKFYNSIMDILNNTRDYSVLLTPHFLSPQNDELNPSDHDILRNGIFNLGFICINRYKEAIEFNEWWCEKLVNYSFADLSRGYFTDQLWVNFAPAFLAKLKILRNIGLNVSNWNLHERFIDIKNGSYLINGNENMIFYHFSNFKLERPDILAGYNNRFTFDNRPEMRLLFDEYIEEVFKFGYNKYKNIPWVYENKKRAKWIFIYKRVLMKIKKIIYVRLKLKF
jgi:lipopolysaccharide biosynthesis glycosyltransferase